MIATERIDATNNTALRTVCKSEGKKFAESKRSVTTHRLDDVIEEGWQKLSDHYGVDMKDLAKSEGYI